MYCVFSTLAWNAGVFLWVWIIISIIIITYLLTAIEFSLGGSSPYTSTDKANKNKYTKTKQYKNTVQIINTVNRILIFAPCIL